MTMAPFSHAPPTTPCSPSQGGGRPAPWQSVRWRLASKVCECCEKTFRPWSKQLPNGRLRVQKEKLWMKQRFCSISCAKIHSNCMTSPETRRKVSQSLKAKGYAPRTRGGNGQLTTHQQAMLVLLGPEWVAEYAVPVPNYKAEHLPKSLKIDIAHPKRRIAVELDGHSHQSLARRLQDSRKTLFLARNGWFVLRITNQRAAMLCSICKSPATLLTSLMGFLSTTAT
ncbi:MAG: endonuclease domain-containing protein [Bryobacteraceae bacterium]